MARTSPHHLLSSIPLFARCSPKELTALSHMCTEVSFAPGEVITQQGSIGREFFVVISGTADVELDGEVINSLGAGSPVGELALLDGPRRTATVTATSAVRALAFSSGEFWDAISDSPGLDRALLTAMAARLRKATDGQPLSAP